jgi:hypothetical protein
VLSDTRQFRPVRGQTADKLLTSDTSQAGTPYPSVERANAPSAGPESAGQLGDVLARDRPNLLGVDTVVPMREQDPKPPDVGPRDVWYFLVVSSDSALAASPMISSRRSAARILIRSTRNPLAARRL